MNKAEFIEFHKKACAQMHAIMQKKNHDYSGAGDDPFSNFRNISGLVSVPNAVEIGFLTRMSDKMSRIGSYVANGKLLVADESVLDTLLDLGNYAILMAGYITEKKYQTQQPVMGDYNGKEEIELRPRSGYGSGGVSAGDVGSDRHFDRFEVRNPGGPNGY